MMFIVYTPEEKTLYMIACNTYFLITHAKYFKLRTLVKCLRRRHVSMIQRAINLLIAINLVIAEALSN